MKKALLTLMLALWMRSIAFAIPTCTISGEIDDGAGNPVANGTVTFNTLYTQVISGNTVAQTLVSTTTDADGELDPIALAQGAYIQVVINGGAPITAIVPFATTSTFAGLISNIVTNPSLTQLVLEGIPTTEAPSCNAGDGTLYFDSDDNVLKLDNNCDGYGQVLIAQNSFPDCPDAGGNHINYIASSGMLTCGTTSSGGGGSGSNPFSDATALVMNDSDNTKRIIISAASITTATTRTYTGPDRNATLATSSGTLTSGNLAKFDASGNVVDAGLALASVSGNTTKAATVSGSLTSGHLVQADASGNLVDSGGVGPVKQFTTFQRGNNTSVSSTTYAPIYGVSEADEAEALENLTRQVVPMAGTFSDLYCFVGTAPGSAKSWAITLRKNASDQTMTCTISGAVATTCTDLSNDVTVVAGDLLAFKLNPAGTPANTSMSCGMTFTPS